jgi:hypothetical protein
MRTLNELAREDGKRYFTEGKSEIIYVIGTFKDKPFKFSTGTKNLEQAKLVASKALAQWERVTSGE